MLALHPNPIGPKRAKRGPQWDEIIYEEALLLFSCYCKWGRNKYFFSSSTHKCFVFESMSFNPGKNLCYFDSVSKVLRALKKWLWPTNWLLKQPRITLERILIHCEDVDVSVTWYWKSNLILYAAATFCADLLLCYSYISVTLLGEQDAAR